MSPKAWYWKERKVRGREGLTFTFNFRGHLVDYSLLALRLSQLNSATLI